MNQKAVLTLIFTLSMAVIPLTATAVSENSNSQNKQSQQMAEVLRPKTNNANNERKTTASKDELKLRIAEKRSAIKEKLADKRLALCEKKEVTINRIMDKRIASDEKHLAVFDRVRQNLTDFIERKQLDISSQTTLEGEMETARQAVVDSISASKEDDFNCETTDATKPGDILKSLSETRKEALREYRTAIREYSQAVKASITTSATEETEETTEGVQ